MSFPQRPMATERTKFVLCGIGTIGHLLPLLALGKELVRRGHECDLLSNRGNEARAREHGLGFRGVTDAQTNNLVSGRQNLEEHVFPSYPPVCEHLRSEATTGRPLMVVNLDEFCASNPMCELLNLPLCRIHLTPDRFRSLERPPWPHCDNVLGAGGARYRRETLPQIYRRHDRARYLLARFNDHRRTLGLHDIEAVSQVDAPVASRIALFPHWFAPRASDWPANVIQLGFPMLLSSQPLPDRLEHFLNTQRQRPLVFTPGTGVPNSARFFEEARLCCEVLGRPGVFLDSQSSDGGVEGGIYRGGFVNLNALLDRSALLVHHGGVGTLAHASRAGIPQIIRSVAYDQPDNGYRIRRLGLGDFFPPNAGNARALTAMARSLLTASEEATARLTAVAQWMREFDAVKRAADVLMNAETPRRC